MRGVYLIRNSINNKIYIGSSKNIVSRWKEHRKQLKLATHPALRLLKDFWKHGLDAFRLEVLDDVPDDLDLIEAEQQRLDEFKPWDPEIGYNTHMRADGPTGVIRTAMHKRRIAKALRGKAFDEARCIAISDGRKNSVKAKAAIDALNASKRLMSSDDVARVVELRNEGKTQQTIADEMCISRRAVRAILSGETYSDVTGFPKTSRK